MSDLIFVKETFKVEEIKRHTVQNAVNLIKRNRNIKIERKDKNNENEENEV